MRTYRFEAPTSEPVGLDDALRILNAAMKLALAHDERDLAADIGSLMTDIRTADEEVERRTEEAQVRATAAEWGFLEQDAEVMALREAMSTLGSYRRLSETGYFVTGPNGRS